MMPSSEAPRVAQPDPLGGRGQCVRGADCTPQTHCNLQPVSLVREGMMISYRVPKVKPLKVLGRGKGEVMEFKNSHSATLFAGGDGLHFATLFSLGSQRNHATPRDWICGRPIY